MRKHCATCSISTQPGVIINVIKLSPTSKNPYQPLSVIIEVIGLNPTLSTLIGLDPIFINPHLSLSTLTYII